jgi:protein O-GlcNAc transferase
MILAYAPLLLALVVPNANTEPTAGDLITTGRAFAQRGQDAKAVPLFEQAVAKDPKSAEAHYLLGVSYSRMEKADQAETHLEKAIALDPSNYAAYLLLGMSKDLRNDPAGALAVYLRAIPVDAQRPEAYREAGSSELLLGKSEAAAGHLERAYTLSNHDADIAADYGYALVRAKQCPLAEKVLVESVDNDPRNADLQSALADALACQGKVDPAI